MLLLALLLTGACSSYYFYPMQEMLRTPAELGLPYDDLTFTTRDNVRLHGWRLHAQPPYTSPRGIVFFLHGNAENISTHIGSVYWLPEQGYEVILLDYRGYGRSEGTPDFPQVYDDVDAAYRWLQAHHNTATPVFILGQSLGAAIGAYYFSQLPRDQIIYSGVVLDAVFSGHRDIAQDALRRSIITWPFQFIVPLLVPHDFDPKAHIAKLAPTPLLFFHSPDDTVIPYRQGETVFQRAGEPKTWITTSGPHIATFNYATNRRTLLDFFERNGALSPSANPQTD